MIESSARGSCVSDINAPHVWTGVLDVLSVTDQSVGFTPHAQIMAFMIMYRDFVAQQSVYVHHYPWKPS